MGVKILIVITAVRTMKKHLICIGVSEALMTWTIVIITRDLVVKQLRHVMNAGIAVASIVCGMMIINSEIFRVAVVRKD